jgi:hypothetical protein
MRWPNCGPRPQTSHTLAIGEKSPSKYLNLYCNSGAEANANATQDHDAPALIYFFRMANPKYKVSDKAIPVTELVDTLSDGTKVKRRIPRMRACNEKDAKGKLCAGHLKRWYFFGDEVKRKFGPEAEIYRCEHCKTLYLPSLEEEPRTGTLAW